jgi:hypothetical protein
MNNKQELSEKMGFEIIEGFTLFIVPALLVREGYARNTEECLQDFDGTGQKAHIHTAGKGETKTNANTNNNNNASNQIFPSTIIKAFIKEPKSNPI